ARAGADREAGRDAQGRSERGRLMAWSTMKSMELSDEDKLDLSLHPADSEAPEFPWGLRITLTHRELEKLGLEADCPIGAVIDLRAFARVTGVNRNETSMGPE